MRLLGWRWAKYEVLKERAAEQNRIKQQIHDKISSGKPGDRVLTRKELKVLGRGLGDWDE